MTILIPFLILVVVIGLFTMSVTRGWPVKVNLLEYQRAVLYRRGLPVGDVGPGRHRVWVGSEKLIIVDARPIQISLENQAVLLADGATALYGISGTARVADTRRVLYSAQNYNQVPGFMLLCSSRSILNGLCVNDLKGVKDGIADAILTHVRPKLERAGFELLTLRVTQISIARVLPE